MFSQIDDTIDVHRRLRSLLQAVHVNTRQSSWIPSQSIYKAWESDMQLRSYRCFPAAGQEFPAGRKAASRRRDKGFPQAGKLLPGGRTHPSRTFGGAVQPPGQCLVAVAMGGRRALSFTREKERRLLGKRKAPCWGRFFLLLNEGMLVYSSAFLAGRFSAMRAFLPVSLRR